jgi:hypothetical protein
MRGSSSNAGVAAASEDAEVGVRGWHTKKKMMWCILLMGATGPDVYEESGGGEGIRLEARWHISVE